MVQRKHTVFISYRREDASFIARSVFQNLTQHGYDVFMDIESIDAGTFDTILMREIETREHFILILSPSALNRCKDAADWLRREIEQAIDTNRNIVPLILKGFTFDGTEDYLTGKLSGLKLINGVTVYHDYFDAAMERLRNRFLQQRIPTTSREFSSKHRRSVAQKLETVSKLPAPTPNDLHAEAHLHQASANYNNGDYDGTLGELNAAIALKPEFAIAYNNRGHIYRIKEEYDIALKDLSTAIRLGMDSPEVYLNRALVYEAQDNRHQAIADLSQAIRLNKGESHYYFLRGTIFLEIGELENALEDFNRAVELDATNATYFTNRGIIHGQLRNLDQALSDISHAIELDPNLLQSYMNKATVYRIRKEFDKAIEAYKELITKDPHSVRACFLKIMLRYIGCKRLSIRRIIAM